MCAVLYDMTGAREVDHVTKRCSKCRQYHGYNFATACGAKINTVRLGEVSALFVNNNIAFGKAFLEYHNCLQFRGFVSGGAIAYAGGQVLFGQDLGHPVRFKAYYQDARFLLMAMQEFEPLGDEHLFKIFIGSEVSAASLKAYDDHLHRSAFPPSDPAAVLELAGDGHEKVFGRVCQHSAGGAGDQQAVKGHGRFMVTRPQDGRILAVTQQLAPENNAIAPALGGGDMRFDAFDLCVSCTCVLDAHPFRALCL
jgi:hypothetical protein